jgi:hypothetical protein
MARTRRPETAIRPGQNGCAARDLNPEPVKKFAKDPAGMLFFVTISIEAVRA